MRAFLMSGFLAAALTTTGGAQQQSATFARWEPRAAGELEWSSAPDIGRAAAAGGGRDYRYEGLVVGWPGPRGARSMGRLSAQGCLSNGGRS
jgi:hypothetical protein